MSCDSWSKKRTLSFLDAIKDRPSLWDATDPDYKDRQKKADDWRSLSKQFTLPISDLKRKLNALKSQYSREKAKGEKSRKSGSGTKTIYKSNWWGIKEMGFLYENNEPVDTADNIGSEDVSLFF